MNQSFTYTISFPSFSSADNYTFSAKEKDPETGLSYFGSRYYSSDLSVWLSVDPMAHKYPSLSPYTYCANNPVMLVEREPYFGTGTVSVIKMIDNLRKASSDNKNMVKTSISKSNHTRTHEKKRNVWCEEEKCYFCSWISQKE